MDTSSALKTGVSGTRGVVGKDLHVQTALDLARAFATASRLLSDSDGPIAVGRDTRLSGPMLQAAVVAGLLECGADVLDLGVLPVPSFQTAIGLHGNLRGGVYVSASHNPVDHNGLKVYRPDGVILYPDQSDALDAMRTHEAWVTMRHARLGSLLGPHSPLSSAGPRSAREAIGAHIAGIVSRINCNLIRRANLRVLVDYNNGTGCHATQALLDALGVAQVVSLNDEPTGVFAHKPEPIPEHMAQLAAGVVADFDIGFAQDPDADRVAIAACVPRGGSVGQVTGPVPAPSDVVGEAIGEEYTLALAAAATADQAAAQGLVVSMATNYSTSRMTEALAARRGWPFRRCPVGEINVVTCLHDMERNWQRGGHCAYPEAKGHFTFGGEGGGGVIDPRNQFCRDSLNAIALILQGLAAWKLGPGASQLDRRLHLDDWRKAALEPCVIVKQTLPAGSATEQSRMMDAAANCYPNAPGVLEAATDDGVWISYEDRSWLHIRPSNTEPLIRVIAEHNTHAQAAAMVEAAIARL